MGRVMDVILSSAGAALHRRVVIYVFQSMNSSFDREPQNKLGDPDEVAISGLQESVVLSSK